MFFWIVYVDVHVKDVAGPLEDFHPTSLCKMQRCTELFTRFTGRTTMSYVLEEKEGDKADYGITKFESLRNLYRNENSKKE